MKRVIVVTLVLALAVTGCTMGPKESGGTVIGGVSGALIGSGISGGRGAGIAIGALAGALIGGEIGRSLDRADREEMQRTAQYALERNRVDETATWRNPDSGNYGTVTPRRTYQSAEGRYCREYQQTVFIGGEEQQAYGTACRQPDGTWKIVK
jgi:surface antigen